MFFVFLYIDTALKSRTAWDVRAGTGSASPHLRRHVVYRAAEGVGRSVQEDLHLAHAEVGNAHVALVVQQNVVQLEVPEAEPDVAAFRTLSLARAVLALGRAPQCASGIVSTSKGHHLL